MALIAKKSNPVVIPPLAAGTYTAVCIGLVDLGEQLNTLFNKYQDVVSMTFEFVGETIERGNGPEPRWISKEYTKSLAEKSNLYRDLKAWTGGLTDKQLEEYDLSQLIGKGCLVSVEVREGKEGRQFNRISGIMALPKGMPEPKAESDTFIFDMDKEETYAALPNLPQFIRERIEKSPTWAKKQVGKEEMSMDDNEKSEIPKNVDPETGEILKDNDCPF